MRLRSGCKEGVDQRHENRQNGCKQFLEGEAGVVGLVEDQAHTFKTKLYLKNGQVKDYSCTCEKGNSYRASAPMGRALFAYYKEYQAEMSSLWYIVLPRSIL